MGCEVRSDPCVPMGGTHQGQTAADGAEPSAEVAAEEELMRMANERRAKEQLDRRRVLEERHDKYTLSYVEENAVGFASGLFLAALEDPGERVFWSAFLATDHFARLLAARFPK